MAAAGPGACPRITPGPTIARRGRSAGVTGWPMGVSPAAPGPAALPLPALPSAPRGPPRPQWGAARSHGCGGTHKRGGGGERGARCAGDGARGAGKLSEKSETCLTRSSKLRRCSLPCQSRRRGISCGRDTGTGAAVRARATPPRGAPPSALPRPPGWSPPAADPGPAAGQPRSRRVSRAEMGWVRRGRANADPAVPRASPVPPGQAPYLVLLQLLHQYLRTEGHRDTHKGRESGDRSAAAPPPRPVQSRPVAARPARPERRLRAHLGRFLAGSGLQEPCDQVVELCGGGGGESGLDTVRTERVRSAAPAASDTHRLPAGSGRPPPPSSSGGGGEVADGAPGRLGS